MTGQGARRMGYRGDSALYTLRKRVLPRWQLYLMILLPIVFVAVFSYAPMYGVVIAFKKYRIRAGIIGSPWVGLDNFIRLFHSYWFPIILKNTVTLSVLSLLIGFPVPIILALMLNEVECARFRKTFQTISYAPYFISTVIMCSMVLLFLSYSSGVFNRLLNYTGIASVDFLQNTSMFKWIYVLSGVWQGMGWGSIIYFAALSGVDTALYEAAVIDGASKLKKIVHINLPALVPTITIMFILSCGSMLNVGYEKVYLLQNPSNLNASEVISTYVYKVGLEDADFSFSTAVNLFNSVINSAMLLIFNGVSRRVAKVSLF